ncbi:hypothetical protein [Polyangium sp. 15x6]|uniref:hypothetical protein n=1 Tax=Polyangium sp. 15x6 TaxID=3042687 RepID=UPI00249BF894|nr:hypothetical protein [Polyangium sp. 15x6]MDI3291337.1 hypothetical protein [Polyangium sp. 15x6]
MVRDVKRYGIGVCVERLAPGMKAGAVIEEGNIVCVDASGYALEATEAADLRPVGRACETKDNSAGQDGAERINCEPGTFLLQNSSGADAVTMADFLKDVFFVNGGRVARTSGGGKRSVAGKMMGLDGGRVAVSIGPR